MTSPATTGNADYDKLALLELRQWQKEMQVRQGIVGQGLKEIQTRFNRLIPDRIQQMILATIKQMTKAVVSGAGFTTSIPDIQGSLETRENAVRQKIRFYRSSSAVEGAVTGYGGFLLGLADLPLWLSLKMKMLFEIAACYGYNIKDHKERVYLLYVFQITFSSQKHRNKVFKILADWENQQKLLPENMEPLDWKTYWEEYRDSLDLAKLFQLIPGFGAFVGTAVNYRLTNRLGRFAMNAYRMRLELENKLRPDAGYTVP